MLQPLGQTIEEYVTELKLVNFKSVSKGEGGVLSIEC